MLSKQTQVSATVLIYSITNLIFRLWLLIDLQRSLKLSLLKKEKRKTSYSNNLQIEIEKR